MKFISAAIFVVVWKISIASRALFLFPVHSKSHLVVVQGLSTFLAQKGHNVTVVSPFPLSKPMENYRDIELPLTGEALEIASNVMKDPNQSIIKELFKLFEVVANMSEKMLEMPEFQKIMNEEKFDLVSSDRNVHERLHAWHWRSLQVPNNDVECRWSNDTN